MLVRSVILFYERGKSGGDTLHREKVNVEMPENAAKMKLSALKEHIA